MQRFAAYLVLSVLTACAHESEEVVETPCCVQPVAARAEAYPPAVGVLLSEPERCEATARLLIATSPDEAWRALSECVARGRFTALRPLLGGGWDRDLQTRPDAPGLITRIIAARGGDVDDDLQLLHDHRIPIFTLHQALARPELYRGALVVVRARLSSHGVIDELRLVSQTREVQVAATDRVITRATGPYVTQSRRTMTVPRSHNLDVPTGNRAFATVPLDPFVDADEPLVVLARFDGMRDEDGWPVLTVLDHVRPSAGVSY
jgi:hypothetical protein